MLWLRLVRRLLDRNRVLDGVLGRTLTAEAYCLLWADGKSSSLLPGRAGLAGTPSPRRNWAPQPQLEGVRSVASLSCQAVLGLFLRGT